VPNVALELHGRRHERVVLGEFELGGEDAAFVGSSFGALDHGFPEEEVIFVDGTGGDTLWWVGGEVFVLLEESLRGYGVHGCRGVDVVSDNVGFALLFASGLGFVSSEVLCNRR
jgi:hypothetical protein